jgi:peptidoglycan/xylan/chitin deacetylase (PgdA/CDA1 family)
MQKWSKKFSLNLLKQIVSKKTLLPYYHDVTSENKAHLSALGFVRTKEDFEQDVAFFLANYQNISLRDLTTKPKVNQFHISFDDGLSGLYTNAFPLLAEKKIDASIFINSDFIDNKSMFYRHKISVLINSIKEQKLEKKIAEILKLNENQIISHLFSLGFSDTVLIDQIAKEINLSFEEYLIFNKPYLTSEQLIEIKNAGFTVGNHGKSHINFNTLDFENQKKQVLDCHHFLNQLLKQETAYFSFPFGDHKIKNELFSFLYNDAGIKASFGVSGIKKDEHKQHFHRIVMEKNEDAATIIQNEYIKYILKTPLLRNTLKRPND